jgi:hypothetical protein
MDKEELKKILEFEKKKKREREELGKKFSEEYQNNIDKSIWIGFTSDSFEENDIQLRNILSSNYLLEAFDCFKKGFDIACVVLSAFCVESCMQREIKRGLTSIDDSFVKNKYLKFLNKATFGQLIEEYQNLKLTSEIRLKTIVDYSKKLNNIRNKYVHTLVEKFLDIDKEYSPEDFENIAPKITFRDAKDSLMYATKIIALIGITRITLNRLESLEKIKNEKIKSSVHEIIVILDKYEMTQERYRKDVWEAIRNTLSISLGKASKENEIDIDSFEKDISLIKKHFKKVSEKPNIKEYIF